MNLIKSPIRVATKRVRYFEIPSLLTSVLILGAYSNSYNAIASAGWYPTHKGETIIVEYCFPKIDNGPIYLQGLNQGTTWKTIAKIKAPNFKKDAYCKADFKNGYGLGLYHFKYKWKVNVSGEWGLQAYSPSLKMGFLGWPDGIDSGK